MRDIEIIKKEIRHLKNSIFDINDERYYEKLNEKCNDLLGELKDCYKKNLISDTEYSSYFKTIRKTIDKISGKSQNKTSSKIKIPTTLTASITGKIFPQHTSVQTVTQKPEFLTIKLNNNLRITNVSKSANRVLEDDEREAILSSSKKVNILTPQIYKVEEKTNNFIQTVYCCGYINMFKLYSHVNNIKNNTDFKKYYDAVLSQMLSIDNIKHNIENNLGNIGYLESCIYPTANKESYYSGYKLVTNNTNFNYITEKNFHKYLKNHFETINDTDPDNKSTTFSLFKIGNIRQIENNKTIDSVTHYLLRTSTKDNVDCILPNYSDKIFYSNINFQDMHTDSNYKSIVLNSIKKSPYEYIGSFDNKSYLGHRKKAFVEFLNNLKTFNKNYPTADSIDMPIK